MQMGKINKDKLPPSKKGLNLSIMEVMNYEEYMTEEQLLKGIKRAEETGHLKRYCYIYHDKDVLEDGTLKKPHWHLFLQFDIQYNTANVAQWFEIQENYVNKIWCGRYETASLYCIHKHDLGKYQYNIEDVVANFDYAKLVEDDDRKIAKKNKKARLQEIITNIENGTIREYNYHCYISCNEYIDYKAEIDKAFQYRRDKKQKEERNQKVIFITGVSGSGKTTFAKDFAISKNLSFYVSSGSNDVLDGYQGQDVLILDDLRPSVMGLSDLLKMLDNNTNSTVKSRYHNKLLECQFIIITSILELETFFHNVFSEEVESIIQFKRRCSYYFKFDIEFYEMYVYDREKRDYKFYGQFANYIAEKYAPKSQSREEIEEDVNSVFGDFIPKESYLLSVSKKTTSDLIGQKSEVNDDDANQFFM